MEVCRQRALAWILLLAYVVTSAFWAQGLVLCIEADGHITLEAATSACTSCCPEDAAAPDADPRQGGSRGAPSLEACACLDVAIGVDSSTTTRKSSEVERHPAHVAVGLQSAWARPRPCSTGLPRSHASLALPLLRSVVLRV